MRLQLSNSLDLVRNGSTVHIGDAMTLTGGRRKFSPSAFPDDSHCSWHLLYGYLYFNYTMVVEDSLDYLVIVSV